MLENETKGHFYNFGQLCFINLLTQKSQTNICYSLKYNKYIIKRFSETF